MLEFILRKLIRDSENTTEPSVRRAYGTLSGVVGIICNCALFGAKYAVGVFSNSIAIISDSFNNLSDCASCIVTLLGYNMSSKSADKKHPFGHGRIEYLTSMAISVIIIVMSLELARSSVLKIIHPEAVKFHVLTFLTLVVSMGVKLWMAHFNSFIGRRINSSVMLATAKDSCGDVIATGSTVVALLASLVTDFPIDGIIGAAVSLIIFKSGIDVLSDAANSLLGRPTEPQIIQQIKELALSHPLVEGIHDLMIHDYGPGEMLGSCHLELNRDVDFVAAHDVADSIEREINEKMNIKMTIHMDPVSTGDDETQRYKEITEDIVRSMSDKFSIHDFQMEMAGEKRRLSFDLLIPFDMNCDKSRLEQQFREALQQRAPECSAAITFDRGDNI